MRSDRDLWHAVDQYFAEPPFDDSEEDEDDGDDWEMCFDCGGLGCDYCSGTGLIPLAPLPAAREGGE